MTVSKLVAAAEDALVDACTVEADSQEAVVAQQLSPAAQPGPAAFQLLSWQESLDRRQSVGPFIFSQLSVLTGLAFFVLEVGEDMHISATLYNDGQLLRHPPARVADFAWVLRVEGEYKVFLPQQNMVLGQLAEQEGSKQYVLLDAGGALPLSLL